MTQAATAPNQRHIGRGTLYFFGALGGILFGYDLGVISGVLVFIAKVWHLTSFEKGMVTASLSVGAMIGAAVASKMNNRVGRKQSIMMAAVVVIIGTLLATFSPDLAMLTGSRLVIGLGVGLSSATVPTYLSELAPSRLRGAMSALNQIFIVLGILIAFLTSYFLNDSANWRAMLAGALVPAAILLI
ncbi:MAG TPA: MFS transporter, partial [Pseudonocardiaceae bacterium]|nr:MFS transporter [Pseudonocardiaceae bacterium]